jgi:hypothetical protein
MVKSPCENGRSGIGPDYQPPQKDGWIAMTATERIKHSLNSAHFKGLISDRSQDTVENAIADALQAYFIAKSRSARVNAIRSHPRQAA